MVGPTVTADIENDACERIVVSGTPYERGLSHGQQANAKINTNVQRYKTSSSLPPRATCQAYIQDHYLPAVRKYFNVGLEEMQGIADGAGISLEDVLLLNARYDLARATGHRVGECTSMAYHGPDGTAYVAQNWDMSSWLYDLNTIIVLESHCTASEGRPEFVHIALTEAGQLARSGMNSAGLGLCANSLWAKEDSDPEGPVLPFTLARRMFLECQNLAEGIKTLCTFPRHVSGNVVAASPELAVDLELTPSRSFTIHQQPIISAGEDCGLLVTHANHFVTPAAVEGSAVQDTYPGGSSLFRDVGLRRLLTTSAAKRRQRDPSKQVFALQHVTVPPATPPNELTPPTMDLTVDDLKSAFSDHASFPRSICEHVDKGSRPSLGAASTIGGSPTMTVACVIYDMQKLEMHVCKGNPCQARRWQTYSFHAC
ncbi:hypothetical protein M409DRAFT_58307 [Zasmidium cellare ATCC 36951]|uniref:Peptidase C45 hydrolase domain-containing protein n=1 Tax=Zasmidium cellare ATCC 36951 TaxID=1080233 RepID=A0A6A6CAA1_ZASCE|nr:uncharacterized protein M409DRAFT_58307 [Zasmidium cellare ATCC 36951]KAF2162569.1 hypothetical protein M409DRAFT_58307 [Zasmidium cellare ATCC 36951]